MEPTGPAPRSRQEIARFIQNTLIRPNATRDEMRAHVEACAEHRFHAAMVPMCWVPLAKDVLVGTGVRVATFFGIGMGHESLHAKLALLRECWALGADEVDYEPNMGYLASGMFEDFRTEAERLVEAAEGRPIKTMLELGYLDGEAKRREAVELLLEAGVPWIKNSSGVGPGSEPASSDNIGFLRRVVGDRAHVKGSGGIREYDQVVALLEAGAELVGSSAGTHIIGIG